MQCPIYLQRIGVPSHAERPELVSLNITAGREKF